MMDNAVKYGKAFVIAVACVGVVLTGLFVSFGVPFWLAIPLSFTGALPATIVSGYFGLRSWLLSDENVSDGSRAADRAKARAQARQGQEFLDRAQRGNPTRGH